MARLLNYNIYENINDETHLAILAELILIQRTMREFLRQYKGWGSKDVNDVDALKVSFTKKENGIYKNLGVSFDELSGAPTFSFYAAKSFDRKNFRFFLSKPIVENTSINY
jgi:hypothetical protein